MSNNCQLRGSIDKLYEKAVEMNKDVIEGKGCIGSMNRPMMVIHKMGEKV